MPDFVDDLDAARADAIGDDLLRLIFTACHPALSQPALTLKLLGGLSTAEIARTFLVSEPTIAQCIVRAKRTVAEARVPLELPSGAELATRLASVPQVVYLIFDAGYTATAGDDRMRPALCGEALRLGRVLAGLAPDEPEVHGLLALMELQASCSAARVDAQGRPVLLPDQDRSRWDRLLIRRGLQAVIAACHARAARAALRDYQWLPSVRGDLLAKLDRHDEARDEFARAAALARNAREHLQERIRSCERAAASPGASVLGGK